MVRTRLVGIGRVVILVAVRSIRREVGCWMFDESQSFEELRFRSQAPGLTPGNGARVAGKERPLISRHSVVILGIYFLSDILTL